MGLRVVRSDFTQGVLTGDEAFSAVRVHTGLTDTSNSDVRILTPAGNGVAFGVTFFSEGTAIISLFEAATISVGTALNIFDLNREVAGTSGLTVTHTPTVSATGSTDLFDAIELPNNNKKDPVSFSGATGVPRILAASTEYLLRYNNNSGSTITLSMVLQFLEL